MRAYAFGQLQLRPWEYRRMTLLEVAQAQRGHEDALARQWEHDRALSAREIFLYAAGTWGKNSPFPDEAAVYGASEGDDELAGFVWPSDETIAEGARRMNEAFEEKATWPQQK